jgi:hypothetical protein
LSAQIRDKTRHQPAAQTQFHNGHQSASLIEGDEGSAQVVSFHGALHRLSTQQRWCHPRRRPHSIFLVRIAVLGDRRRDVPAIRRRGVSSCARRSRWRSSITQRTNPRTLMPCSRLRSRAFRRPRNFPRSRKRKCSSPRWRHEPIEGAGDFHFWHVAAMPVSRRSGPLLSVNIPRRLCMVRWSLNDP